MSDLDDRLIEARAVVESMDPPPDLWARIIERANDPYAPVHQLRVEPHQRRRVPWLTAAAVAVVLALGAALLLLDDEPSVDGGPATEVSTTTATTTPVVRAWSGPVREPSDVVQRMATDEEILVEARRHGGIAIDWLWDDPFDAADRWADIVQVRFQSVGPMSWTITLAAAPHRLTDVEPGVLIAYGLVFDTNGDGAADHVVGIDNDAPKRGDFHIWLTDLSTGETKEQIGPPYGFPVEFAHPSESGDVAPTDGSAPTDEGSAPPTMHFTFLRGSVPADLDPKTVRFYAWTSVTRDGVVVADDFAPDTGWITTDGL